MIITSSNFGDDAYSHRLSVSCHFYSQAYISRRFCSVQKY